MADFALNRNEFREIISAQVEIFRAASGAEQRRRRTSKITRTFEIKSPYLTKSQLAQYVDFFLARYGSYERFTFTNPNDDVSYNVRFTGAIKTTFKGGLRSCSFGFEVTEQLGS